MVGLLLSAGPPLAKSQLSGVLWPKHSSLFRAFESPLTPQFERAISATISRPKLHNYGLGPSLRGLAMLCSNTSAFNGYTNPPNSFAPPISNFCNLELIGGCASCWGDTGWKKGFVHCSPSGSSRGLLAPVDRWHPQGDTHFEGREGSGLVEESSFSGLSLSGASLNHADIAGQCLSRTLRLTSGHVAVDDSDRGLFVWATTPPPQLCHFACVGHHPAKAVCVDCLRDFHCSRSGWPQWKDWGPNKGVVSWTSQERGRGEPGTLTGGSKPLGGTVTDWTEA